MSDEKVEYNEDGDLIPPRPKNVPSNWVWKSISGVGDWFPPEEEKSN